ncbi:TetR/AcrR family transcriptional regulator [Corynebacterium belfantii]|uniref:TetR/AcrR family transcriptional regulator n=1 Tax=Corynebacterium belfantii TaxID=2014537 RepID=UPI00095DEA60|nr:TetR/AcrR family transcriptional regulator [Corynebacterium belfantii]MBG9329474.1 TetR/AcrR family transcriptional regulator [Corynebacterium belfantii]MBG9331993.1 TetR/AcrR family transcriptional regulator [Corynebacterium belfantii]OLN14627.1 hypothetical protein BUE64_11995 [Corynebacterium diphtheriae subsp. lausannense]QBZ29852.1 TetR/AcrR family transcriptional regulator [Corynebacterium diphtheriae subsp. lausannense]
MKADQILQGYVSLLVSYGEKQATLDAVAREVGLSKAGLLHHFHSRAALNAGLVDYLRALVREDVEAMKSAAEGAAHYYLASSFESDSPLERAVVAVTRLWQGGNEEAGRLLREARDLWFDALVDDLGDPFIARFVMLAGDGVSYHMDIAKPTEESGKGGKKSPSEVSADDIEHLTKLVSQLQKIR